MDEHTASELAYKKGYEDGKRDAGKASCSDCKHWIYMGDGLGDCTNPRFHLDGHPDPTMTPQDYCSLWERRDVHDKCR